MWCVQHSPAAAAERDKHRQRQQGRDGAGEVDDEQVVMWWRQGSQQPTQEPQYSQEAGGAST